jgi:hypothetical protein
LDFATDELNECQAMGRSYAELGGQSSPDNYADFFGYFSAQRVGVLFKCLHPSNPVDSSLLAYIDSDLKLTNTSDPVVKREWYMLGIRKGYEAVIDPAYEWLGQQGRNYYVKGVMQALVDAEMCTTARSMVGGSPSTFTAHRVISGVKSIAA